MDHLNYMQLDNIDDKIEHQKNIMNRNLDNLFTKNGNLRKKHQIELKKFYKNPKSVIID